MSAKDDDSTQQQSNSFYAALARTATRSLALYFSRPVRLFRPSKGASSRSGTSPCRQPPGRELYNMISPLTPALSSALSVSGWHSLRGLADSHGQSLSPQYVSWLVKEHGVSLLLYLLRENLQCSSHIAVVGPTQTLRSPHARQRPPRRGALVHIFRSFWPPRAPSRGTAPSSPRTRRRTSDCAPTSRA